MDSIQKATQTQLENIQKKTSKNLPELKKLAEQSGLQKHGQIRKFMSEKFDLGYGDANVIASYVLNPDDPSFADPQKLDVDQLIAKIYTGPKEKFFDLHTRLMQQMDTFGDFTISPKKNNVSLRRRRQFVLIGPATNNRFEVGLNLKQTIEDERLKPQPKGSMCNYIVVVNSDSDIDAQLIDWMRMAYEEAE